MPPHADDRKPATPSGSVRALVTGGAGFIGSHLVERLVESGCEIVVVDDLSTGRLENLNAVRDRVGFIKADLRDGLRELAGERFDEIYHLAAAVGVQRVLDDPIAAVETNVETTAAVLRFSHHSGQTRGDRPITLIASSSEVYGKPTTEVFSEENDVLYGPTSATRWSYAQTKALDEYLAMAYDQMRDTPTVTARFFNTVGPRQVGDYGMVLPRFVAASLRGESIEVYGDGQQSRCFCDVRDVVEALPRLVRTPHAHGRVFNLGADRPISIVDLAETVRRVLGSTAPIRFRSYEEVYAPGFEDLRRRRPDLARVREEIGFEPKIDIERTIRDLAEEIRGREAASLRASSTEPSA
ncbi:MAG: GDP-mannose 4,6-dehydratase [Planctomycetota bacterium]